MNRIFEDARSMNRAGQRRAGEYLGGRGRERTRVRGDSPSQSSNKREIKKFMSNKMYLRLQTCEFPLVEANHVAGYYL